VVAVDHPQRDAFPAWTGWLVAAMAATVLLYAIDILASPLPFALSELFQKFASGAVFLGTALLCRVRARSSRTEHRVWWLFAVAMLLWSCASAYYALVLWDSADVPVPSLADGLWLLFYLPTYAALILLLRLRARSAGQGEWLDALVSALGVSSAGAALVFGNVLDSTSGDVAATITRLAYPVADLGLLGVVAAAITLMGWRGAGVWRWVAPAFAIVAIADSTYLDQVATSSYSANNLLALGWPVAALMLGVAAWQPERRAPAGARRQTSIAVPALFGFAALGLLVADHFSKTNALALMLATGAIFVMLVRLFLTVQDNERLLAHSRQEATTDALTGLGNRRQLAADLESNLDHLDPGRPLVLTLLDLNGFKQYNDTFGHPAGDQLLERLGRRLSNLVAGHGAAYRMGGDEFCTLWREPAGAQPPVTTLAAAAALSEHGEGFSIDCSYGSVTLPGETSDSADALRTADRRMYARKPRAPTSAGKQSSDVLLGALVEHDSELGTHLGDVAELACATASRLGVTPRQLDATRQTALLHDVGKVGIPDEILGKAGPLDDSEWEFMRRHTIIGERIIGAAPALEPVARLVRSTHERWDGAGYPDGLAGPQIPLVARIVAVCDAYHAMVTDRSYREAMTRAAAVTELRDCAGAQFDPEVVEGFVAALEELDPLEPPVGTPS
jgi:diguanylate cyclase (GGDEF)-like protein